MHVGRAFDLLKETAVRAEIETRGLSGSLNQALETWRRLKADHRLDGIIPACPISGTKNFAARNVAKPAWRLCPKPLR